MHKFEANTKINYILYFTSHDLERKKKKTFETLGFGEDFF